MIKRKTEKDKEKKKEECMAIHTFFICVSSQCIVLVNGENENFLQWVLFIELCEF